MMSYKIMQIFQQSPNESVLQHKMSFLKFWYPYNCELSFLKHLVIFFKILVRINVSCKIIFELLLFTYIKLLLMPFESELINDSSHSKSLCKNNAEMKLSCIFEDSLHNNWSNRTKKCTKKTVIYLAIDDYKFTQVQCEL